MTPTTRPATHKEQPVRARGRWLPPGSKQLAGLRQLTGPTHAAIAIAAANPDGIVTDRHGPDAVSRLAAHAGLVAASRPLPGTKPRDGLWLVQLHGAANPIRGYTELIDTLGRVCPVHAALMWGHENWWSAVLNGVSFSLGSDYASTVATTLHVAEYGPGRDTVALIARRDTLIAPPAAPDPKWFGMVDATHLTTTVGRAVTRWLERRHQHLDPHVTTHVVNAVTGSSTTYALPAKLRAALFAHIATHLSDDD